MKRPTILILAAILTCLSCKVLFSYQQDSPHLKVAIYEQRKIIKAVEWYLQLEYDKKHRGAITEVTESLIQVEEELSATEDKTKRTSIKKRRALLAKHIESIYSLAGHLPHHDGDCNLKELIKKNFSYKYRIITGHPDQRFYSTTILKGSVHENIKYIDITEEIIVLAKKSVILSPPYRNYD